MQARLGVRLPPSPGSVPVVLEYRLLPEPGGRHVELALLSPEGLRLVDLRATGPGGDEPLQLPELRPRYRKGSVRLAPGEEAQDLLLRYSVEGGWSDDGRILLPIPAVTWAPEEPTPRTFVATVEVPQGITITESFPTSVTRRPRGSEGGPYEMTLQAVPSVLILRVSAGEPPFLGLEGILDTLVVLALLAMGMAGIRYLKGGGE